MEGSDMAAAPWPSDKHDNIITQLSVNSWMWSSSPTEIGRDGGTYRMLLGTQIDRRLMHRAEPVRFVQVRYISLQKALHGPIMSYDLAFMVLALILTAFHGPWTRNWSYGQWP